MSIEAWAGWLAATVILVAWARMSGKLSERSAWLDAVKQAQIERLRTGSDYAGFGKLVDFAVKRSGCEVAK